MKFEVKNTGTEPLALSNGSVLAPGEVGAFEDAFVGVGPQPETTLQQVWDKVHALGERIEAYFEPATPATPDTGGNAVGNSSTGGGNVIGR